MSICSNCKWKGAIKNPASKNPASLKSHKFRNYIALWRLSVIRCPVCWWQGNI